MALRKKVVWKTPEPGVQEISDGAFHAAPTTRDAAFVADLNIGDLLYVKAKSGVAHYPIADETKRPPPAPFLSTGNSWNEPAIPAETIGLYLGTIRTNEIPNGKMGMANRILRHVVGFNGKKYLVLNWNDFAPVAG